MDAFHFKDLDLTMTAANCTEVVDSCIQSLMELASRSAGYPDTQSIHDVISEALERVGNNVGETALGKGLLEHSLRTKANLVAPAAPEVAGVLMKAYHVTTSAWSGR
ncbi:hypothetical protein [Caballeronia sp. AZ7_KS35]|uniref:hypothetical protein n=1 Tax=Caballeronia sp. AZ7_KS35 TaxID=2921762 RepID=UPI0020298514|nr:hypothetical protein [Caballeronia sp. AZ7_KS35]